ncbi:MAG: hypothetical protein H6738_24105 [Alphaproteobacteria bacterium]|nr:hypothetical protein [Alphaproteobacteria bacterium]MCB9699893.1 hypothetical protein [Alphaproteobacteria bacterium]
MSSDPRPFHGAVWLGVVGLLLSPVVAFAALVAGFTVASGGEQMLVPALLAIALVALLAGVPAIVSAVRTSSAADPDDEAPRGLGTALALGGAASVVSLALAAGGALWAVAMIGGGTRGRPLRSDGVARFAGAAARTDWADPAVAPARDAADWVAAGLAEHASIASFARLALELLALGAPPELVERAHLAAIDEIRHARLSFGAAGGGVGPGPLPAALQLAPLPGDRRSALAAVARASAVDGWFNEGREAGRARRAAATAETPELAAIYAAIADDEARHAALGRDVAAWCAAELLATAARGADAG